MREVWFKVDKRDSIKHRHEVDLDVTDLKKVIKAECSPDLNNMAIDKIIIKDNEGNLFNSIFQISKCNGYGIKLMPFCVDKPSS